MPVMYAAGAHGAKGASAAKTQVSAKKMRSKRGCIVRSIKNERKSQ